MKRAMWTGTLAMIAACGAAVAQDAPKAPEVVQPTSPASAQTPEQSAAMRDQLVSLISEAGKPVEAHKVLELLAGDFEVKGTLTLMPGVDVDWESEGRGEMILGGRFMELNIKSKPGAKVQIGSKTIFGYDTRRDAFTIWGIDTMGTYSVSGSGTYDEAAKKLVLMGTEKEGGRTLNFRFTYLFSDTGYTTELEFEMAPNTWARMGKWEGKRAAAK
ncbi:MAG: DUF1579 family protein [Phycisphaerales bacterium]